nr:DeoR/GlpR family DNA-binding transcription regulator [Paenactinomyces guangxiensis]
MKKVHGGAVLGKTNIEANYLTRKTTNIEEKKAIAKEAARLIEDGDALFIDLGTTTLFFAQEIKEKKNLTVITNSLPIAIELSDSPNINLIIPGGNLRNGELSLSGPLTRLCLENFYVDKAILGIAGISLENGYTNLHIGEAEVTKMMIKRSQLNVMLADYSKFEVTTTVRISKINDVDILITDSNASEKMIRQIRETGTKVTVANL